MKIPNDNFCISEDGTIIIKNARFYIIVDGKKFCLTNILEENQELKKQLEENKNPLRGIFAQVNDDTLLRDCGNMNAEINELKNQQKEFIEYLEDWLKILEKQHNELNEPVRKGFLKVTIDTLKEILSKYKEIIGDNK